MVAKRRHAADDENGRQARRLFCGARNFAQRARDGVLRRKRSVVDERRGIVFRVAVRQQRVENARELASARVADDRATEFCKAAPVDVRWSRWSSCPRTNVSVLPPPGYVTGTPA
jgi:hypothetical protein